MILPMTTHLPPTTRAVAAAAPDAHDVSPCAPEADATEGKDICWCGRETYAYYSCEVCG